MERSASTGPLRGPERAAAKLRLPRVPGRPQEETGPGSPGTHRGKLPLRGFNEAPELSGYTLGLRATIT